MKYIFCLVLLGIARANPVVVNNPENSVVNDAPVAKEPVIGIVDSVQHPSPIVPLVNAPKVQDAIVEEVKSIVPDVVVPEEKVIVPISAVVEEKVVPAPVDVVSPSVVVPVGVEPVVPEAPVGLPVVDKVVNAPIIPTEQEAGAEKHSDPSIILSEPIDKVTKLVIDLDEHVRKYLPSEEPVEVPAATTPVVYSGSESAAAEGEGESGIGGIAVNVVRQNQMTALIEQVNRLAESIENTITDLVARRRYVTAAMLRSMLNYVRRVRVNLERLQNRLQSVQAVATSGQNSPQGPGGATVPPAGLPGTAFFNTIRDRINRITEEIGALVSRIRGSFTPLGATTSSPLPPLATAANIQPDVAQASAAANLASVVAATSQGSGVVQAAQVVQE